LEGIEENEIYREVQTGPENEFQAAVSMFFFHKIEQKSDFFVDKIRTFRVLKGFSVRKPIKIDNLSIFPNEGTCT